MNVNTHSYRWTIVGIGALMTCVALGAMFSLAIFLDPLSRDTGWSRAGVSAAMTLNFLVMGAGAFGWGALSDRYGTRLVVSIGAVLLGLALVLASRAQSLLQFQLVYGVLVGLAASTFFAPMIALTTAWFDTHRSLAVSLVSAGMGVAPMTISPLARWLITAYDWRTAMFLIGILAWVLLIPAAVFVRQPPVPAADAPGADDVPDGPISSLAAALRSRQFIVLGVVFFLCCAAHSGPIFHMVTNAMEQGVAKMTAATVFGVSGLASIAGRLLAGVLADRFGPKRTLLAGLLAQAVSVALYLGTREVIAFQLLAVAFGVTYGGVMPLYALVVREYFGEKVMGTAYGAVFMVSTLGMGLGSFAGGYIHDQLGSYAWLFVGSAAIGAAAVGLALTFRAPRPRLA
jgi:MFS family permease